VGGCSPKEEKFQMSDNSTDDDEHYELLNTPLDETGAFEEAAASMEEALESGDHEKAHEELAKTAAVLRKILERIADLYGMDHDRMCILAMMAISDMAQDTNPQLRRLLASHAAIIDAVDAHHC
jgi:hypothetical protein